jgi:tight adherence protein C
VENLTQIIILAGLFLTVVLITLWIVGRLQSAWTVNRRLRGEPAPTGLGVSTKSNLVKKQGVSNSFLSWVQSSSSISESEERSVLARTLAQAGFDQPSAPVWFVIVRFAVAIGAPLLLLFALAARAEPVGMPMMVFGALVLCAMGLILPRAIIDRLATNRKTVLENQFPDALDLMVVCVEAGLGLESAFVRVATETQESHTRIAREFQMVSDELRAGRSRADALRGLGKRTDVPALKSFSALLIQTDALGTSIAQTLRTFSQEMREHRFLKAEEKAMRIPVLMTVPLVVCILPVIITALLLPAIIDVVRQIVPAMQGVPSGG